MSASELADTIRDAGIIVVDGQRVVTTTERDMIVAALRSADVSGGERERIAGCLGKLRLETYRPESDPDDIAITIVGQHDAINAILARQPSRDNSREE